MSWFQFQLFVKLSSVNYKCFLYAFIIFWFVISFIWTDYVILVEFNNFFPVYVLYFLFLKRPYIYCYLKRYKLVISVWNLNRSYFFYNFRNRCEVICYDYVIIRPFDYFMFSFYFFNFLSEWFWKTYFSNESSSKPLTSANFRGSGPKPRISKKIRNFFRLYHQTCIKIEY